ncbi:glycosyltransferase [Tolypothrix sp. VBCCA 56010]|uniref:glycosyltransferase n=1 Tax=Tolypothrix sp. VBCCA 56010 TaxID=3137731 RepID=UPI003D7ECABE
MKTSSQRNNYIFFTRNVLTKPEAKLVQVANSANAAANLGYSTVLVYSHKGLTSHNPISLIRPFSPRKPEEKLAKLYNLQEKLKVAPLSMPWFVDKFGGKLTNSSTLISKYYFPFHILPTTKIVHTRDWNFVKVAIRHGIPAIYEHHHHEDKKFEPEIVKNPLFTIAITVADTVRESMIQNGMPPEKVVKMHNGYSQLFATRQPEAAEEWREKLLQDKYQHMVVYSGALYPFKGVDLLIDVAKDLPHVQFVFAGGKEEQVQAYQQMAREKQVTNTTFLGYIEHHKLGSLLQAADILAHPHCSGNASTFTSPLKFFDYMAAGTPIVSTEIPPLMEFKPANVVAAWCEPDNPQEFARCIKHVLETRPRKIEGYSNSLEFVKQFTWENRIQKILSYVDDSMRPVAMN